MHDELLRLASPRRGHFVFESGHHGNLWLDLDRFFAAPELVQPFVAELARHRCSRRSCADRPPAGRSWHHSPPLWEAEQCPLCAAGAPVERLV